MLAAVRDRRGMKKKYTNSDNDAELVSDARRGDRDAFARLVVKYQDRIFNAMFRMTGSRDDAADLAQEAFLKALNNLPKFDGRSRFSTWLWSVALNLCTSKLRRRKVERASGVRIGADSFPDGKRAAYDPPDGAAGPAMAWIWAFVHVAFPIFLAVTYPWWQGRGEEVVAVLAINHAVSFAVGIALLAWWPTSTP